MAAEEVRHRPLSRLAWFERLMLVEWEVAAEVVRRHPQQK